MRIKFTDEDSVWDPTSSEFSKQEATNMNYRGEVITCKATARGDFLSTMLVHAMLHISQLTQILV